MELALDHVLLAVPDLGAGLRAVLEPHGLRAGSGGFHPAVGTANRIVALGGCYLALITVVDAEEAAASARGRRTMAALAGSRLVHDWAVRCRDLDRLGTRLRELGWRPQRPIPGSRTRPDGLTLNWWTMEADPDRDAACLPYFIQWESEPAVHPGRGDGGPVPASAGIDSIVLAHPQPEAAAARLEALFEGQIGCEWVAADRPGIRCVRGHTGGRRFELA